jgi:hypothetical protein
VTQQLAPVGEVESQLPPLEVDGVTENSKLLPVLEMARTCGKGSGAA